MLTVRHGSELTEVDIGSRGPGILGTYQVLIVPRIWTFFSSSVEEPKLPPLMLPSLHTTGMDPPDVTLEAPLHPVKNFP